MIRIVLCDDEKEQRAMLKNIITTQLDLKGLQYTLSEFDCGEALCQAILKHDFDIIFLDIEMKALDGVATAKNIRLYNKKAVIIFVTAYSDFVFQGYEVRALNYILKPYKREKIVAILSSAIEQLKEEQDQFFAVESKGGTRKLNLSHTQYFFSDKRKVHGVTLAGTIEFYEKLDDLEKQLPKFFIRIHQRYLVNLNFISAIEKNNAVVGSENLPISRQYYQMLMIEFAKTMLE